MRNKYGVFIIESLNDDDYFDGKILKEILELSQVNVQYRVVKDKLEFESS